jgi:probable HAF family extracellular repeat protein
MRDFVNFARFRVALVFAAVASILTACQDAPSEPVREVADAIMPTGPSRIIASAGATDVGHLGAGVTIISDFHGLNDLGYAVGLSWKPNFTAWKAFRWTPTGGMEELGDLGGSARALGINAVGDAVGLSYTTNLATVYAVRWPINGGMQVLGSLGGRESVAYAVNSSGVAVGHSIPPSGFVHRAVRWSAGGAIQDLGTLGGSQATAYDINVIGDAVGWSYVAFDQTFRAVRWPAGGGIQSLGTLGGNFSWANAINDHGHVVGRSTVSNTGGQHAFLWTPTGGMQDLGTLGGNYSEATDINEAGDVIGVSENGNGEYHPFIWTPQAGMQSISHGTGITGRFSFNNVGQVAAQQFISTITFGPNAPPSAGALTVATQLDTPVELTIPASDPEGRTLVYTIITDTQHGWISGPARVLTYTPNPGFSGTDAFTYKVRDDQGLESQTATVSIIVEGPDYTPTGGNVSVTPVDASTGAPAPVSLSFANVTNGGTTTVTSGSVGGVSGPPAPGGFRLGNPATYYDVVTTATFAGSVELCFDYSGASYGNENNLKLLHFETNVSTGVIDWADVTTTLNTTTKIICGSVTSLSPFLVAELNAAPVVTSLALPAAPVPIGTSVTASAAFTDANPNDSHTATFDWDNGTTSSGSVSEANGSGSATGSRSYSTPGVYTVTTTVSDGDLTGTRSSSSDQPAYIVVYDPSTGFVTGGGWIDSPVNACRWSGCASDGSTTGKASFGFVSRYQRGATTPTGNTEFQFKAGGLSFGSTSYQWLVVSGARAQYKGEGQIAGDAASYGFLLTAIDGALPGGGTDRFRIKIWNIATGAIVYDNQIGQLDDSSAATELGGGSIVIHR